MRAAACVVVVTSGRSLLCLPFNPHSLPHCLCAVPRAEYVAKLSAVCQTCGQDAAFSRRLTADTAVELIGGEESYVPVDRRCFHEDVLPEKGPRPLPQGALRPRIELVLGPVKSGKSSELLRLVQRFRYAHQSCLVVTPRKVAVRPPAAHCAAGAGAGVPADSSSSSSSSTTPAAPAAASVAEEGTVTTHDNRTVPSRAVASLTDLGTSWQDFDVIAVDEAQLFGDLCSWCDAVANYGKVVLVAALDGDYTQEPYGAVCDLVPLAETVMKLSAVCFSCGADAPFSRRMVTGFQPCCRACLEAPLDAMLPAFAMLAASPICAADGGRLAAAASASATSSASTSASSSSSSLVAPSTDESDESDADTDSSFDAVNVSGTSSVSLASPPPRPPPVTAPASKASCVSAGQVPVTPLLL